MRAFGINISHSHSTINSLQRTVLTQWKYSLNKLTISNNLYRNIIKGTEASWLLREDLI